MTSAPRRSRPWPAIVAPASRDWLFKWPLYVHQSAWEVRFGPPRRMRAIDWAEALTPLLGVCLIAGAIGTLGYFLHAPPAGFYTLCGVLVVTLGVLTLVLVAHYSQGKHVKDVLHYDVAKRICQMPLRGLTVHGCRPVGVELLRIFPHGSEGYVDELFIHLADEAGQTHRELLCWSSYARGGAAKRLAAALGAPYLRTRLPKDERLDSRDWGEALARGGIVPPE